MVASAPHRRVPNHHRARTDHEAKSRDEKDREEVARGLSTASWLGPRTNFFSLAPGPRRRELTLMPRGGPRGMAAGASNLSRLPASQYALANHARPLPARHTGCTCL